LPPVDSTSDSWSPADSGPDAQPSAGSNTVRGTNARLLGPETCRVTLCRLSTLRVTRGRLPTLALNRGRMPTPAVTPTRLLGRNEYG